MKILKRSRSAIGGGTAGGGAGGALGEGSVVASGEMAFRADGAFAGVFGFGPGIISSQCAETLVIAGVFSFRLAEIQRNFSGAEMAHGESAVKITKRTVDAVKANGTDFYVFDSELIGFGIRVRSTGAMSYIVRYRAGSGRSAPVKRVTIAKVGKVTPDQARDVADITRVAEIRGGRLS